MKTLSLRHNREAIRNHCVDREPFKTHGKMSGRQGPFFYWDAGDLSRAHSESFFQAEYAVFSYGTPVAWYGPDGWTKPSVDYGPVTARHLGLLDFINAWIES